MQKSLTSVALIIFAIYLKFLTSSKKSDVRSITKYYHRHIVLKSTVGQTRLEKGIISSLSCARKCTGNVYCKAFTFVKEESTCNIFECVSNLSPKLRIPESMKMNKYIQRGMTTDVNCFDLARKKRKQRGRKIHEWGVCGRPNIPNTIIKKSSSGTATFKCTFGFGFCSTQLNNTIFCQPNGNWSRPLVSCKRRLWNGFVKGKTLSIKFPCSASKGSRIAVYGKLYSAAIRWQCTLIWRDEALTHEFILQDREMSFHVRYRTPSGSLNNILDKNCTLPPAENRIFKLKIFLQYLSVRVTWDKMLIGEYHVEKSLQVESLMAAGNVDTVTIRVD